ncbi:hypothetical protein L1049_022344 [Liquidambar formosana]|uniref:Uncharacterized protein n=1 Tax=Liquidambar formosana TaxID=63359 RepID=A0AAP0RCB2_LIQFO
MKSRAVALIKFRFLFAASQNFLCFPKTSNTRVYSGIAAITLLPVNETLEEKVVGEVGDHPKNSEDVFRRWGCTATDISRIFRRQPALRHADIGHLQSRLSTLRGLGLNSSGLVKIINCRPRFLSCHINHGLDERLEFLTTLFGSRELLLKAIVRNPSLLTYDFHNRVKPVIALYEEVGVSRKELIPMLMSRPTLIPRTSLTEEKMEYIRRTGVSKDSKMYKHMVTIIAISRLETIREKLVNLEKFGFSEDEVLGLFGRSPFVLTLSVDKVQRNMTFVLGTMKLPASLVLSYPFLLFFNLENILKPRFILAGKIQEMGLEPQIKGPAMLTALRMTEKRFLNAFVSCHPMDVTIELMDSYRNAKDVKRLAEASKKNPRKGFPF